MKHKILYTSTGAKRRQNACSIKLPELIVVMLNNSVTIPYMLESELLGSIVQTSRAGRPRHCSLWWILVAVCDSVSVFKWSGAFLFHFFCPSSCFSILNIMAFLWCPGHALCCWHTLSIGSTENKALMPLDNSLRKSNLGKEQTWLLKLTKSNNSSKLVRLPSYPKALFRLWQGYL